MGYRIEYEGAKQRRRRWPFGLLLCLAVAMALLPKETLRHWLLPGDPEVTAQALSELVETLGQGTNAGQAVAAFCRSIVRGAGLG